MAVRTGVLALFRHNPEGLDGGMAVINDRRGGVAFFYTFVFLFFCLKIPKRASV